MHRSLVHFAQASALAISLAAVTQAQQLDDVSTTQPTTTEPAPLSDAQIKAALSMLNSPDTAQQASARVQLMGLSREQLPALRHALEQFQPVSPSMAASVHEIVLQVYLADEPYPCRRSAGFLGLRWGETGLQGSPRLGVPVGIRLPGFPSYRLLQTGDLILGLIVEPNLPLQQAPNLPTPDLGALQNAIRDAGASHDIVLEVLREGERLRLPVTLYPALEVPSPLDVEAFTNQRLSKGELYWHDTFLPLMHAGWS